jgi:predicted GIY-YIG superfamily endonuclease
VTEHALYRFYDATGQLLYVGITNDPGRRFGQHADSKPWWHAVANIKIEVHPSRADVLSAEREAIVNERPLHNVIHNADARTQRRWYPDIPPLVAVAFVTPVEGKHLTFAAVCGVTVYQTAPQGLTIWEQDWEGTFTYPWDRIEWLAIGAGVTHQLPLMLEQWERFNPTANGHAMREKVPDARASKRALAERAAHVAFCNDLAAYWDDVERRYPAGPPDHVDLTPEWVSIFHRHGMRTGFKGLDA